MRRYKMKIINNLMLYMSKNDISNKEKEMIYKIVINLPYVTEKQVKYFEEYFGIKPKNFLKKSLAEMKENENISSTRILQSIKSLIRKLYDTDYKNFKVLEKIYIKYQKEDYNEIYNVYKDVIERYKKEKDFEKENIYFKKIDNKGKIIIPLKIRKSLNIKGGDILYVNNKENKIILENIFNKGSENVTVKENGLIILPERFLTELNIYNIKMYCIYCLRKKIIIENIN